MPQQLDLGQFVWPDAEQGRQPTTALRLDESSPLTRGLYLLSYGDQGYDIVGRRTPTLSAASKATIKSGKALAFTGGSTFSGESYPDTLGNQDEFSVLVLGSIDNVSNRQSLFTKGEDNPAGEWSLALGYNAGGAYSNFFFQSVQTPATGVDAKGTTTVANGEEFVVVGTYKKSGTICVYKNGRLEDSQAVGGAALRTDSTSPPLAFGVCNSALSAGGGTYYYGGKMALRAVWTRQLSAAEVASISANPWQLFAAPVLGLNVPAASITGTLARTNANDTSAASGSQTNTGTLARTNANDASTASGSQTNTGTLAKTNANDSVSASGSTSAGPTGTLAKTNANDTVSAAGNQTNTGTVARTNANDAATASGTTTPTGTLARTNANDTATATGAAGTISGTLAVSNANDTANATGQGPGGSPAGGPGEARKRRKPTVIQPDTSEQRAQEFEALLERISGQAVQKAQAAARQADVSALIDAPLPDPQDIRPARMPDVPPTAKPYMQELLQSFREGYRQAYVAELAQRIQQEAQARDDEDVELLALAL